MSLRFVCRLAAPLGLFAFVASAFLACGGIASEGSSGSSGSSQSSSGTSGTSNSSSGCGGPAGDCKPPTTTTPPSGRIPKVHRAAATACIPTKPVENPYIPEGGLGPPASCHSNAECTDGRNGRCDGNGHDGYRCTYDACYSDSECSGGGVCACNGASRATNNVCLTGGCQVDANCGAGGFCSPTLGSCGHYGKAVAYYCHTAEDECVDDEDCGGKGMFGGEGYCAYEKTIGRWKCSTSECAG